MHFPGDDSEDDEPGSVVDEGASLELHEGGEDDDDGSDIQILDDSRQDLNPDDEPPASPTACACTICASGTMPAAVRS